VKYKWTDKPPIGIPGVSAVKSNVWPKPLKESLKYAIIKQTYQNVILAIGKLKSGRWEVYIYHRFVTDGLGIIRIHKSWLAKSKLTKTGTVYHVGYTRYVNAYRSIPAHLRSLV